MRGSRGSAPPCSIDGCPNAHKGHGLCGKHLYQQRHDIGPNPRRGNGAPEERFWRFVAAAQNNCWQWTGHLNNGYGTFGVGGGSALAHRFSYEMHKGAIPAGLTIDHLCYNSACVNPDHLEAVTQAVNNARRSARVTSCPAGHAYDEANTYVRPNGARRCRTCRREKMAIARASA